jgi:hypothetical protein
MVHDTGGKTALLQELGVNTVTTDNIYQEEME